MVQKLLWGSELTDGHVCLGNLTVGGNFVFCLIIVYLWDLDEHIGWGRILKLSNKRQVTKGWEHFYDGC